MKAFMGGFLGFECKEGIKESNHLSHFLIQGYGWIEG